MKEFFLGLWLSISAFFTGAPVEPMVGANSTISNLPELTSLDGEDLFATVDTSAGQTKKLTWDTATTAQKAISDTLYSPIAGSGSITTVGTITSGTWNGSLLTIPYGGTGTTTWAANRLFVGNGTGGLIAIGGGTAGQYLTSNGAGSAPSFQSSSVDQAANYTWTGVHVFNSTSTTFSGTTTFNKPTLGAGIFLTALASSTFTGAGTPQPVMLGTSTNSLFLSSPSGTTTDFLGFALSNVTNGGSTTVQIEGVVSGFTGLVKGAPYYVTGTGTISTTVDTNGAFVGYGISSTELLINRGPNAQWQFLGSSLGNSSGCSALTCTATATMPTLARIVVIQHKFVNAAYESLAQHVVTKANVNGSLSVQSSSGYNSTISTAASVKATSFTAGNLITTTVDSSSAGGSWSDNGTRFFFYR